jgi:signal transduction histidine kinase/CheY-like chemotaxis protein
MHLALRTERDVVQVRQRAREIAAELGLDNQDQIRMATATSEMARNAFRYASNGKVTFSVALDSPQALEVTVSDSGPGIANLDEILEGRYRSDTGLGMGILGTRRLMDGFEISTATAGTEVRMIKHIPKHRALLTQASVRRVIERILERAPDSPYEEIDRQNQELLKTLHELRSRQEDLELLNRELEDTNRGVVALYAELDERADYLRRASDLKTKFLSNVSHEFRTPLNSIISLSRMLLDRIDGSLTSEQVKQVRYIESSATDLQELVNDLLDLAKVEAGKIRMRPKRFEVQELFSALKGMLKPLLADNSSVTLVFDEAAELPPLYTDEGKVSQILRNLISNALKFTPRGQVSVSARVAGETEVLFTVADTGIGIASEHHETIFREFSQIENPLQQLHRGTGLGLPLCRNLTMLLGGSIFVESEPGRGSTFYVQIPTTYVGEAVRTEDMDGLPATEFHRLAVLILDEEQDARWIEACLRESEFQPILVSTIAHAETWLARHTPAAILAAESFVEISSDAFPTKLRRQFPHVPLIVSAKTASADSDHLVTKPIERESLLKELRRATLQPGTRRLLIVDDNEVSRYILHEVVDQPWLEIREANCGVDAIAAIRDHIPDALILDLLMPDMNGLEVLRQLRANPATENLPVMIYTSKPLTDAEREQLESLQARIVRKEEVSSRLSAQPFLDWLKASGVTPTSPDLQKHA